MTVTGLSVTPVKGTRLHSVEHVELDELGARGNRRFFVIDGRGRMLNGKQVGELQSVIASVADGHMQLEFPGGGSIDEPIEHGEPVGARFFSLSVEVRPLTGPLSSALSEHLGREVRIVEPSAGAVDRGTKGGVSLISQGSLARLAHEADEDSVDARRFRMLIEIDDVEAHEEDGWVGRSVAVGDAVVRFHGHVGRCLTTSRDPESGVVDLPTLDLLRAYRGELDTTEPLPFGVYGEVIRPGPVRVGDTLTLL